MIINNSTDMPNKEKSKQERGKAAKGFTAGIGIVIAAVAVTRIILAARARKKIQNMKKKCSRKNGKCKLGDK